MGWSISGMRGFIAAEVLKNHTSKKTEELSLMTKYYRNDISIDSFRAQIKDENNDYHNAVMDASTFSYPYLAGLIDSDGSISVRHQKSSTKYNYYARARIYQSNAFLCQSLADQFGGSHNKD